MKTIKTTIDRVANFRTDYFNSLPKFQELFIELKVKNSDIYLIQQENKEIAYAIKSNNGILIEFYVFDEYIPNSNEIFRQLLKSLSITDIYCKSFDALLLNNCLLNSLPYSLLGLLYRDYAKALIENDPNVIAKKADASSIKLLLGQDESIKELFETEQQLSDFIQNENVFEFYNNDEFIGCGMVIRTHSDWDFCDLGVWVKPSKRGNAIGSQMILKLRDFAIKNNIKPSCGCGIENLASQKAIKKSGFVSRDSLINFKL